MKNYQLLYSLLFLLIQFAFGACNAQQNQKKEDNLSVDAFIRKEADSLFKQNKLPGLFIGVLDSGKRTYYNYGYADPANKTPFDSVTLFEAGSITKTFTAFILTMVLHDKKIDENESIISYLPDSVSANKNLEHITFLKLLNHTSGLPRLPDNLDLSSEQPYQDYDVNKLFSYLKNAKPNTDGKSEYSNLGFGLAGTLAERIADRSYEILQMSYASAPSGMLQYLKKILSGDTLMVAQGHFGNRPVEFWEFDALGGAGKIRSSAAEMLSYLNYMANPEIFKAQVEKVLEPSISLNPRTKIGRAWIISESPGKPTVHWHNGGTYGFSTFAAFLKGQQKAVIVVVNQFDKNQVSDKLGMMIMDKLSR